MDQIDFIFSLLIFVMSVIVHEVSHGLVAAALGDPTAKLAGRLTLNPIKHIDPFGSVFLPLLLYFSTGYVFGWAKPVPYNPYNLRDRTWGEALVAAAGPISNILIALFFGLILRFGIMGGIVVGPSIMHIVGIIVIVNIVLALFNLVPIPPLDGSKILFSILPFHWAAFRQTLERYGFFILLFFVFFLWEYVSPVVRILFELITGIGLLS